jgi:predicted dehydrogenase
MAVLAAAAKKHVYCEKPLTLGVAEGREIVAAVRKHKVVFQTGSHERSNPVSKFVCEAVKNGAVGKVTKVVTTIGTNNKESPPPGWKPAPVPDGFDYARWLGPAPEAPYHPDRCLYRFRFVYDYSGGQITNFGAHCNDMAHWGLGLDRGGPSEVECLHAEFPKPGSLFDTALVTRFRCAYPNGVELVCETGKTGVQTRFEGPDGWVQTGYAGTTASRPELLKGLPVLDKKKDMDPHSLHMKDFVEAVKAGRDPAAPVEVGHASAVLCHVANAAIRRFPKHGRQVLKWDAAAEKFTDNDDANAALVRPRRAPWDKLPG